MKNNILDPNIPKVGNPAPFPETIHSNLRFIQIKIIRVQQTDIKIPHILIFDIRQQPQQNIILYDFRDDQEIILRPEELNNLDHQHNIAVEPLAIKTTEQILEETSYEVKPRPAIPEVPLGLIRAVLTTASLDIVILFIDLK